ncbi:3893_t:CDS:1 [Acaulospora colombiana]|uniref:3893_t:CDS:1 n=1 Tax=Acaulospora colombiana TaxID=27376 RepID=A0ACA9LNV8_9GLOM|nr:3893_t:CDS:1 [Acaulospora colombiana]
MFRLFELTVLLLALLVVTSSGISIPYPRAPDYEENITATLEDGSVFCSFLPPDYGGDISGSEGDAVAFCNTPSPNAPGARIFPDGFIRSYHFNTSDGYIQVTGTINRDAYGLKISDEGGQYDSVGSPPHAACANYDKFVNLVEPDVELFCIRCCTDTSQCDTSHSQDGCRSVIPGDYS